MYYPAMLDIEGKICIIAGGGTVAARKCKELANCGAVIKVVSPQLTEAMRILLEEGKLEWINEGYAQKHLAGAFLCFACTDSYEVNKQIAEEASKAGVLVNIADNPEMSSFVVPATRRQSSITLAVSCNENPAASRFMADYLNDSIEDWMPDYIDRVYELRLRCRQQLEDSQTRQQFMKSLFARDIIELARLDVKSAMEKAEKMLEEYVRKAGEHI